SAPAGSLFDNESDTANAALALKASRGDAAGAAAWPALPSDVSLACSMRPQASANIAAPVQRTTVVFMLGMPSVIRASARPGGRSSSHETCGDETPNTCRTCTRDRWA